MEIVAICGSPRRKGNTATLLEAFLEGARESAANTVRFDPARMNIHDCDGDSACTKTAEAGCIQNDAMQEIYDALKKADAWVLATPVYFGHVASPLKRVIDRFFAFYTLEDGWHAAIGNNRRGAVIVVQADASSPMYVANYLADILLSLAKYSNKAWQHGIYFA